MTAVWQAATAQGWTDGVAGRVAVSVIAMVAAVLVAAINARRADPPGRRLLTLTAMAAGYVITGSALVPLLGAALLELIPTRARIDPSKPAETQSPLQKPPPPLVST